VSWTAAGTTDTSGSRVSAERGSSTQLASLPQRRHEGKVSQKWLKVKQAKYREGERGWEPKSSST